ncbi:hypothetical protein YC2023_013700 [Brassica napus]
MTWVVLIGCVSKKSKKSSPSESYKPWSPRYSQHQSQRVNSNVFRQKYSAKKEKNTRGNELCRTHTPCAFLPVSTRASCYSLNHFTSQPSSSRE